MIYDNLFGLVFFIFYYYFIKQESKLLNKKFDLVLLNKKQIAPKLNIAERL